MEKFPADEIYEVEHIVDQTDNDYLVKWKGYANNHSTWEPKRNMVDQVPKLVDEFHRTIEKAEQIEDLRKKYYQKSSKLNKLATINTINTAKNNICHEQNNRLETENKRLLKLTQKLIKQNKCLTTNFKNETNQLKKELTLAKTHSGHVVEHEGLENLQQEYDPSKHSYNQTVATHDIMNVLLERLDMDHDELVCMLITKLNEKEESNKIPENSVTDPGGSGENRFLNPTLCEEKGEQFEISKLNRYQSWATCWANRDFFKHPESYSRGIR